MMSPYEGAHGHHHRGYRPPPLQGQRLSDFTLEVCFLHPIFILNSLYLHSESIAFVMNNIFVAMPQMTKREYVKELDQFGIYPYPPSPSISVSSFSGGR